MSCCGKQRDPSGPTRSAPNSSPAPVRPAATPAQPAARPRSAPAPPHRLTVDFEYLGNSALNAIGPVTGRRYHFNHRAAKVVAVDVRDREALAGVPYLREVKAGER